MLRFTIAPPPELSSKDKAVVRDYVSSVYERAVIAADTGVALVRCVCAPRCAADASRVGVGVCVRRGCVWLFGVCE